MSHCHSYSLKDTGSNDLFSLPSGAAPQVRQAAEEEEAAVDAIKKSLEREKSKEEKTIGTFKLPKGLERELKDTQITDIY